VDRTGKRWQVALCGLLLVVATLAAFWPALHCQFTNYDDPFYVTDNPVVRGGLRWESVRWAFTALHAANWHPLTWLAHMLDQQLFGPAAWGHHLTSLLWHAANGLLVLLLLHRLTGRLWPSAFVAAAFALHPLRVESVAWVAERKDVLSACCGLLTLLAYVNYARKVASPALTPAANRAAWGWYGLALTLFALGLMSKPMLVTWPGLLLLLDYWPLGRLSPVGVRARPLPLRRLLVEKLPFFALAAASAVLTLLAQRRGGSVWATAELTLGARLANAVVGYAWYVGKLFWPVNLAVIYPLRPTRPLEQVGGAALLLLLLTGLACWQARRRPALFVGWCWFAGLLVPVSGLVQVGMQSYADRYTYLPHIGLLLALAWGVDELVGTDRRRRRLVAVLAAVALLLCAVLTHRQTRHWQNGETLFTHALRVTRDNAIAHFTLGAEFSERKQYERAIECYQAALRIAPAYADAWNNLGVAYLARNEVQSAVEAFRQAVRAKPGDARFLNGLGTALHQSGDHTNAAALYTRALQLNPAYAEAHFNLGNTLAALGDATNALRHYEQAVELRPDYAEARINRGFLRRTQGDLAGAQADWEQALALRPDLAEAHNGLALLAHDRGDLSAEIAHLRAWLAARPDDVSGRTRLAMALGRQGQTAEATAEVREVIRRQPDHAPAHYCLGVLLQQQGQTAAAVQAYQESLRCQPNAAEALNNLAWIRAAHPDPSLRDGPEAVRLAERACALTQYRQALLVGTLAAAYAEAGRFAEAIRAAEQARALAQADGNPELARRNQELLELYRAGRPYHQTP